MQIQYDTVIRASLVGQIVTNEINSQSFEIQNYETSHFIFHICSINKHYSIYISTCHLLNLTFSRLKILPLVRCDSLQSNSIILYHLAILCFRAFLLCKWYFLPYLNFLFKNTKTQRWSTLPTHIDWISKQGLHNLTSVLYIIKPLFPKLIWSMNVQYAFMKTDSWR